MRKVIVTMLLAGMISNATAAWLEVSNSALATSYVDPTSVRRTDNMVKIMTLMDLKSVYAFNGKPYSSVKADYQYDCTEGHLRTRTLSLSTFPNNMGEGPGKIINSTIGKWEAVTPGTTADVFSKFACEFVRSGGSAEWVAVVKVASKNGHDEDGTAYANPTNMSKSGDKVKMWSLMDFKTALDFNRANVHIRTMSIKNRKEYDCREKKTRELSSTLFSENMGEGVVNYSESVTEKKWESVPPNSVDEGLWEFACGKRKALPSQQP